MPGVLMVEAAAQLCAWTMAAFVEMPPGKFFAFAGIDGARFRGQVVPGDRLLLAARVNRVRRSLATYDTQAWVRGELVFEGQILGVLI
jgi:3-hydroxyacyl-[acyl-carrier-protein] dehydratase